MTNNESPVNNVDTGVDESVEEVQKPEGTTATATEISKPQENPPLADTPKTEGSSEQKPIESPQEQNINRRDDPVAKRAKEFLIRIRSRNYQNDEQMLQDECYDLEKSVYGITAGERGAQWNGGVPFKTAKEHAKALEGVILKGYSSIAPEGFDEWMAAKNSGASRAELAKLANVPITEYKSQPMGLGSPFGWSSKEVPRPEEDIDKDIEKYEAKLWARNFMNVYKAFRPEMSDKAAGIVDRAIQGGDGLRKEDADAFLALDGEDRDRVANLIMMSRANVPDFMRDLFGSVYDISRQMAEGTAMAVEDMFAPTVTATKLIAEGRQRIEKGLVSLTEEEQKIFRDEAQGGMSSIRFSTFGPSTGGLGGVSSPYTPADLIAMRYASQDRKTALLMARRARDEMRRDTLQIRMLTERKPYDDYNWGQEAIIGAVTTIPYMAEAALPGVGFMLVAMQQFENVKDKMIMDGYNPSTSSDEGAFVQFALACAYAGIEKLQVAGIFGKPLTAVQYRTLMESVSTSLLGKVREVGGKLSREVAAKTVLESLEEGLQGGVERGTISAFEGKGFDKTVMDVANGIAEDYVKSLGTMGIISLVGTGGKVYRSRTGQFDSESTKDFMARQLQVRNIIRDSQRPVTDPVATPKLAARRETRANEILDKAAQIWRGSESRAEARNQIEDLLGLDEDSTRMVCEWLADRDTILDNIGKNRSEVVDQLKAAYGTDNILEALYKHGRSADGNWDLVEKFFKDHYLASGMTEEKAAKQAAYQVKLEKDLAAKGLNYRSPTGVFSNSDLLDPVAFMRTFINPDLTVEDSEAVIDGKKMKGSAIVIPIKKQDGTTENFKLFSIVRPEGKVDINSEGFATDIEYLGALMLDKEGRVATKNGKAIPITKEVWKGLSKKQKEQQIELHGWKVQGGFRFVSPTGASVSVNGILSLFNKEGKYTAKSENRDIAHEIAHAVTRFAREAGAIGKAEAETMRAIFGDPIHSDELWDEERMADAFRDYLQDKFDFGKINEEYRGPVEAVFEAIRKFIINMLRALGVDVGDAEQNRRSAIDAVWEGIQTGDFSKLREYTGVRFKDEGGELKQETESDKGESERYSMLSPKDNLRYHRALLDGDDDKAQEILDEAKDNARFSVSAAEDAAYMDAVKRNDMKTAQRMVREAAAKAMPDTKVVGKDGLPLVVYRGDDGMKDRGYESGMFVSRSENEAGEYGKVYKVFVNAKKPFDGEKDFSLIEDEVKRKFDTIREEIINESGLEDEYGEWEKFKNAVKSQDWLAIEYSGTLMDILKSHGYDAVEIYEGASNLFLLDSPSQIKSADPVTYDDAGNVIPLSQRFNPQNNDIRFSVVTDKKLIEKLDSADYITVYRAAIDYDGNSVLSPKATQINGVLNRQEIGKWYKSDENPDLIKDGKFKLDAAKRGSDISAAYAPYWHTRLVMANSQFSAAWKRPDITVFECRIPKFELEGTPYQAEHSKKFVGLWDWSNSKPATEKSKKESLVYLTQYMKIVRKVPITEIAQNIVSELGGAEIPWNTVSAPLREELRNLGANVTDRISGLSGKAYQEALSAQAEEKTRKSDTSFSLKLNALPLEEAKKQISAQKNIPFKNFFTELEVSLSSSAAGKLVSQKAAQKSIKNGFTYEQHNAMAANVGVLFQRGFEATIRGDKDGDVNIKSIRRYVCPVEFEDKKAFAWITVKESKQHGAKIYSVEGIKLEAFSRKVEEELLLTPHALNASTMNNVSQSAPAVNGEKKAEIVALGNELEESDAGYVSEEGEMRLTLKQYNRIGREKLSDWLKNPANNISEQERERILTGLDGIARLMGSLREDYVRFSKWQDADVEYDPKTGKPYFKVVVQNAEYKMNFDFSTVCVRRRPLDNLINALAMEQGGILEQTPLLTREMIATIQEDVIKKHGFDVACALCFVDTKRYTVDYFARRFAMTWNTLLEEFQAKPNSEKGKNWKSRLAMLRDKEKRNANYKKLDNERDAELANYVDKRRKAGETKKAIESSPEYKDFKKELQKKYKHPRAESYSNEENMIKLISSSPEERTKVSSRELISSWGQDKTVKNRIGLFGIWRQTGAGRPKDSVADHSWNNEIIDPVRDLVTDEAVEFDPSLAFAIGGVRIQSFSDYVPTMVFDYMQMIAELAAKGLPMHTYTKEEYFVKIFGHSGIKMNMSLVPAVAVDRTTRERLKGKDGKVIPAGLDENGDYLWSDECFPTTGENSAFLLRDQFDGNVGTIAVGVSDEHILKLLRDPKIDMVIPYHASGINDLIAWLRYIQGYEDYSSVQHEKYSEWKLDANGNPVLDDMGNKIPSKWGKWSGKQYGKSKAGEPAAPKVDGFPNWYSCLKMAVESGATDVPRTASRIYREFCYSNDIVPRFNAFGNEENYYKLLSDFRMYNVAGEYAPQGAVQFNFGGDEYNTCSKDVLSAIRESLAQYEVEQDAYDALLPQMLAESKAIIREQLGKAEEAWAEEALKVREKLDENLAKSKANKANNTRYKIVGRDDVVNASDYARAFTAASILQGKEVSEDDVGKLLKGLRLPVTDAPDVLASAKAMATNKMRNIGDAIAKDDPELLHNLAKSAMTERFNKAMVSALMGGAQAADPIIGQHLEQMRQRQLKRALDSAKGYSQAQMRSELYVNLSAALFKVAEYEKSPEEKARLAAAKAKRDEERRKAEERGEAFEDTDEDAILRLFDEEGNLKVLTDVSDMRKAVPESVKRLLDKIMAGANKREDRRKRKEAKKAESKAQEQAEATAEGTEDSKKEESQTTEDTNFGEENIDEFTFDLLKPVFSSPDQFASFLEEWVFRKLKEKNPRLQGASCYRDPVNLRELQNTAKDVLHNLAKDTLGKTPAYITAERQIDRVLDYKYLSHVHNHIAYVYGRIHENALRINRNKLIEDLVKELKKRTGARGRFSNVQEEMKRKVFAQTELWVRSLIPYLTMSDQKLTEERTLLEAELAQYNTATPEGKWEADNDLKYQTASLKYTLLQQYGGMKRWMIGDIIDASNEILRALDGNIQEFLLRQEQMRQRNRSIRQALIDAMEDGYKYVKKTSSASASNLIFKAMDNEIGNIELRLKDLIKYCRDPQKTKAAEKAIEEIMYQLGRGHELFSATLSDGRKQINEILTKCYGSAEAGLRHLNEALPEVVKMGEYTFSPEEAIFTQKGDRLHTYGQLLQLYGSCLQGDYHDNIVAHGRDNQLGKMFATLTYEDWQFHKALIEWYKRNRLELSDAVQAITGLPVRSPDDNYIPVCIYNAQEGFAAKVQAWNPITASMTNRIRHGLDFDEAGDILRMVDKSIQDRAQIIGYGQVGIFLRDTLAHRDVQNAGRQYADKGQMGKVIDQVTDTLTQARPDSGNPSPIQSFFRQGISLTYLAWNVVSGIKQFASLPVWANLVGLRNVVRYMVDIDMDAVRELMATDGYKARYELGWTPETQELLRNPNPNKIKALWEKGMCTSRFFDQVASLWMAQGVYRDLTQRYMNELTEDGSRLYTVEEAKQRAATIAWNWCEQTQQTGRKEFLNDKQRNNALASFFYQFMTSPLLQLNFELDALRKVVKTGGANGKAELARAVVINHLAVPAITQLITVAFQALGLSWRPDDDDDWKEQVKNEFLVSMVSGACAPLWAVCSLAEGIWTAATQGTWKDRQVLPSVAFAKQGHDLGRLIIHSAAVGATELGLGDFADVTIDDCLNDLNKVLRNSFAPYRQADNVSRRWTGERIIGE